MKPAADLSGRAIRQRHRPVSVASNSRRSKNDEHQEAQAKYHQADTNSGAHIGKHPSNMPLDADTDLTV
jgi:hypothetical protein